MADKISIYDRVNFFDELLSFSDAARIWGIHDSTLRKAVTAGKFKIGIDCKKFGKQWVICIDAMRRVYGEENYSGWV